MDVLWTMDTLKWAHALPEHPQPITDVRFNPKPNPLAFHSSNDELLYSCDDNSAIHYWSTMVTTKQFSTTAGNS
jgi:hypothetical protein